MIFPFLDGFLTFTRAPITWLLILLNVFLFSQFRNLSYECQEQFEAWYQDDDYLYTQGQIYKQYKEGRQLAQVSNMETLGRLAFRDEDFLNTATKQDWDGDQIAIKSWKRDLDSFLVIRAYYPPMLLGVSNYQKDFFSFVSYQFYHEGFYHLLGNLLLILIIGGYLERRYTGKVVFITYLLGGVMAALMFTLIGGLSGAPLVGASGSLCALLGFLVVVDFKTHTRLFYMILPFKKYMGFVLVPTFYWVIWLCMLEDLSGWIAQPGAFSGGVAHAVHLFGFVIGCALGWVVLNLPEKWVTPKPLPIRAPLNPNQSNPSALN